MANEEHLGILRQGSQLWNQWRREHSEIRPDLVSADLREANLRAANLHEADLREANLSYAYLVRADLRGANLSGANFSRANLMMADLRDANIRGANFLNTNLAGTNLEGVFVPVSSTTFVYNLFPYYGSTSYRRSIWRPYFGRISSPRIVLTNKDLYNDLDAWHIIYSIPAPIYRPIIGTNRKVNYTILIESKLSQIIILFLSSCMIIYPFFFFLNALIHKIIYISIPLIIMLIVGITGLVLGYKWRNMPYD